MDEYQGKFKKGRLIRKRLYQAPATLLIPNKIIQLVINDVKYNQKGKPVRKKDLNNC